MFRDITYEETIGLEQDCAETWAHGIAIQDKLYRMASDGILAGGPCSAFAASTDIRRAMVDRKIPIEIPKCDVVMSVILNLLCGEGHNIPFEEIRRP